MKKRIGFIALVGLLAMITACAPATRATGSPNAVSTKVEQTIQLPLTTITVTLPVSASPTHTLAVEPTAALPTPTQSGAQCNDTAVFITDVTIPDGTVVTPGQAFTKTWRLKNSGSCTWTAAYTFGLEEGPANAFWTDTQHPLSANIEPGQSMDITVNLSAPAIPGDYTAYYQLRNPTGVSFLNFTAVVKVQEQSAARFAVTNITYAISTWSDTVQGGQYTDCPLVTATITTNGAGTVNYYWLLVSISNQHQESMEEGLVFDSASSKTVSWRFQVKDTPRAAVLYIASPNNASLSSSEDLAACSAAP